MLNRFLKKSNQDRKDKRYLMEYKFKTLYNGELIPCIPNAINNQILKPEIEKQGWITYVQIGLLYPEEKSLLRVLPIFQYTGKKDMHGEEIYCGHIVQYGEKICTVMWDRVYALYRVVQKDNGHFSGTLMNSDTSMQIIGHEALK